MDSDYIVYIDESGDHGLQSVDVNYPVFCLTFCIFNKTQYAEVVLPAIAKLKFQYWGHNDVIFHERDIRKTMSDPYTILGDPVVRENFLNDINLFMRDVPFQIISTVIHKNRLTRYTTPSNPYELGLTFCMERLHSHLLRLGEREKRVFLLFEARGNRENNELELEFRRICDNAPQSIHSNTDFSSIDYRIRFLSKKADSAGLQIADLAARPIGLKVFRPTQTNRAFDILEDKFICHNNGAYRGRGLKEFP